MNAKICDRCGSPFIKSEKHPTRGRVHGSHINGIAYYSSSGVDSIKDMCDDCLDDLFDFMTYDESIQEKRKNNGN